MGQFDRSGASAFAVADCSAPSCWRWLAALIATLVLVACGGSGDDEQPRQPNRVREHAQAFVPPNPIPADANAKGMWSPLYNWPLIAIHSVLLPDGRVMTYGSNGDGQQTAYFIYDVWDSSGAPDAGHMTLPNTTGTDIFCGSQLLMPQNGKVFFAGGDNWTGTSTNNMANNDSVVFDPATNTLQSGPEMNRYRWYSTSTMLTSGEIYVQGGQSGTDRAEIRAADGTFRLLAPSTSALSYYYPRNFVAPDGRVFGFDSYGLMYFMNTSGTGTLTMAGSFDGQYAAEDSSVAMFRPGRALQFGGNSNGAIVIDFTGATPTVTPTQSMSTQRRWVTGTLLPDGKVLATGGSQVANQLTGVNNNAEIWDPQTGQWTLGAAGSVARLYHSTALLLPDASVLVAGGGAPGPLVNTNAEIYYPPYLFTSGGQRASRPAINAAPTSLAIGNTFSVDVGSASPISRVTLIKSGSMTHSFNMDQRFLDLTFNTSGSTLKVQAPTRAALATPGYYLLFVIDSAGVPSVAKILRIGIASDPNPSITPVVTNPGNQSTSTGAAVSLQVVATDPNNDAIAYSAAGLPPGITLNPTTGLLTGTPTASGTYNVVITASDGINAATASFVWTVNGSSQPTIDAMPVPSPVQANSSVTYTAQASGSNLQYTWNFGDGTGDTVYTPSPSITHTFAAPGTHVVTLTIRDGAGQTASRSFLQQVYLPPTAQKPSASSNIVIETPTSGSPRLWVVNQDNDSVSVFDTVTQSKLGEVSVGTAPRSVAVAANGMVWVTNKRAASISVIDPATRTVTRTINLPRASLPFGIAMTPSRTTAFVALEGTGQVLKFDTASYAQQASVSVGPNPRQLSVSADGANVYVSRFITPPLPGEATATISANASTGGEVVVLNAGAMTISRTVVLQNSTRPDAENQGRGIPNYLGAATISPDGTQAWLPSKQDDIARGGLRDGSALTFQNTVRAISSRIVLANGSEDLSRRVDHDNASVASAAAFDPLGVYLFVALETSREIAVVDAHGAYQVLRIDAGRAPQGLAVSADGKTLYVNNFMDRSVGVYDLQPLLARGQLSVPLLATWGSVGNEKLAANVLNGKQLFYDARDTRLARDRYMSCATCHNDGGHDGRVWDLTSLGEGLRNTINLRGRAGAQGRLHWSANFDEVQDFEGQIRTLAGGSGLMTDAAYNTGTRNQPLGDRKTGVSSDLDALAAYVQSLASFDSSPFRNSDGSLTASAQTGQSVFTTQNCATCHSGTAFTASASTAPVDIGTIKPSSGKRLGSALTGIDIPTLRDVWATAPYLHDGSAPTLGDAVKAHQGISISDANLAALVDYLKQIGAEEPSAPGGQTLVNTQPSSTVVAAVANGTAPTNGGIDGSGAAYSATLLGTTLTWNSTTFTFAAAGSPNGATSTTLTPPAGSYAALRMLATGLNGNQPNQNFIVTYTDNSTTTFTQSLSDWATPQSYAGESIALKMAYRVGANGAQDNNGPFNLYGYSFALNSAKTVKSLTLPNNRNVVVLAVTLVPAGTGGGTGGGTVATPVFSPAGGTYSSAQTVSITDSTAGASIVYTTDGSSPATSATAKTFTGAFSVSATTTVNAVATASGMTTSAVATATYTISTGTGPGTTTSVSLGSAATLYAIVANGTAPPNGGIDGSGAAYSAALLGTTLNWNSTPFSLGAAGSPNGAANTTLTLPAGSYATLRVLAAGLNGNQANQSFVVTYTDNSTTTFTQSLSDWFTPQSYAGESIALAMAYRVGPSGAQDNRTFNLYGYSFALNSAKTVKSVKLPATRNVVVLAATLVSPTGGGGGGTVATPVFSPAGGTYSSAQTVSITDSTAGASIVYTSDGSSPATSSTAKTYTGAFSIATTTTVNAIATASGMTNSAVASATYTISAGSGTGTSVGFGSAASIYAIVTNGTSPASGGIDGSGAAYSATLLGSTLSWSSTTFNFGAAGSANGMSGGTLTLPSGSYATLKLLATGVNGNQANQTFIVNYTDGSTTSVTQSVSDWFTPQSYAGESVALAMAYRVGPGGAQDNRSFNLYGYSLTLNSAKTVKSVTLPSNRNVVVLAVTLK